MIKNDQSPLMVTIRCLCYNHEPYIRQCLEGFVMQKTDFLFEAVIHDDASTDGSAAIIHEYAEKYPDIIKPIFEEENQYSKHDGSLRKILDGKMHGKYIAVCEGDDYWIDPLKLQKQVDFLESHPDYTMCFHNAIKLYVRTNTIQNFNDFIDNRDLTVHEAIHNWLVPSASVVFRKEYVEYPDWMATIYSGDYSLILRCINGGKIYGFSDYMSIYRINEEGSSATAMIKGKLGFVEKQHIILLESFNKGTNFKFKDEVNQRVKYLHNRIKYQHQRVEKSPLILLNPLLYNSIMNRIKRFLLLCRNLL